MLFKCTSYLWRTQDLRALALTFSTQEKNIPTTEFHYENLVSSVMNLFLAGTETSSSTIRYALSALIKNPDIQGTCLFTVLDENDSVPMLIIKSILFPPLSCTERMQKEIDGVVAQDRSPKMEDRKSLPFTDAVIHEVQRFLDIVPFGLPHYTLWDVSFRGYTIPKVFLDRSF